MNILIFANSSEYGGAEAYTLKLAHQLQANGHSVTVATFRNGLLFHKSREAGISTLQLSWGPKLSKRNLLSTLVRWSSIRAQAEEVISKSKADLVVLQFKLETLVVSTLDLNNVPIVVLEHGPIAKKYAILPVTRLMLKRVFTKAKVLLAVSDEATKAFKSLGFSSVFLGAGVDEKIYSIRKTRVRESKVPNHFLYLGRLEKSKGVDKLLDLFSKKEMRNLNLTIAGQGKLELEVLNVCKSNKNIFFQGFLESTHSALSNADAGILLSLREGRPLFVLECIASGIPVFGFELNEALLNMQREFGQDAIILCSNLKDLVFQLKKARLYPIDSNKISTWSELSKVFLRAVT